MKPEKDLLELARGTLKAYFDGKEFEVSDEIKKKYSEKRASFVTLTKNGQLRGCIGSLIASRKLWVDVQENAINAAFHDFRFPNLTKQELDNIKIEISVLTAAEKLEFDNWQDLLEKLDKNMGVIVKKGMNQATYLPQVWGAIADKQEFLSSLCIKAGLAADAWKNDIEVYVYEVEKIAED